MEQASLEKLLEKSSGSRYKLVVMAARRALDIAEGQNKFPNAADKPAAVALQEIAEGKVKYKKAEK